MRRIPRPATGRRLARLAVTVAAALGVAALPATAQAVTTYNLDDTPANWHIFYDGGTGSGSITGVTSPSEDGSALKVSLSSGSPYLGIHAYQNLPAADSATVFQLNLSFYFPTATPIQALEFTENSWIQGTRYEWAMQWERKGTGVTTPVWRVWAGAGKWQSIGVTQNLAAGAWHTLQINGDIVGGNAHYTGFHCDGLSEAMGQSFAPVASSGDYTAVAVQLDGDSTPDPYSLYIDGVTFAHD